MKKIMVGFAVGFFLAAILAILCMKLVMVDKYKFGHVNGMLDGQIQVLRFLHKHFGVRYPPEGCKEALIMKPGGIYVIEDKGVLTIRTTEY